MATHESDGGQGGRRRLRARSSARSPSPAPARRSCGSTPAASATATRSPRRAAIRASRYPLVPGHEIAGEIAALGEHVKGWEVGQRVGVGWFGGNCGYCEWCRRGSLIDCENMGIPGVTMDGGYADYVVVRATRAGLDARRPRPRGRRRRCCAPGITTFNALRTSGARAPAAGSRCSASAASATSACSSRPSSASRRWRSPAGPTRRSSPASSAPTTTSTAPPAIPAEALPGARRRRPDPLHGDQRRRDGGGVRRPAPAAARCSSSAPRWIRSRSRRRRSSAAPRRSRGHASGTSRDSEDTLAFSVLQGVGR